jgi:DNA polymerase lambda
MYEHDQMEADGFDYLSKDETKISKYLEKNKMKWAAANPNLLEQRQQENKNKELCDELKRIGAGYEAQRDQWRARGHNLAAAYIARHPTKIRTVEEASQVYGVGKRILAKIEEFLAYGQTRKTRLKDEETIAREDLGRVHGIGPSVLDKLWTQGIRSLDQLRQNEHLLTRVQKIGLKYVEEFQQKIPREEIMKIEQVIFDVAAKLDHNLVLVTCGSYRRGKASSGDIDILITHKFHQKPLEHVLQHLVQVLTEKGIITDQLTHSEDGADKWMGVCRLNEQSLHRRLDFQLIPRESWAFALLYFTGSAHCNRSMRHWAGKLGMSLSQHALVMRPGGTKKHVPNMYKMPGATRIHCKTEEDIFTALKINYLAPHERDW